MDGMNTHDPRASPANDQEYADGIDQLKRRHQSNCYSLEEEARPNKETE